MPPPGHHPTIREAFDADRPRLIEMGARFARESMYGQLFPGITLAVIEALVDACRTQGVVYVAEVDKQVVGMIAGMPVVAALTGELMVDEIVWWVDPEQRAGRVGPMLLKALEAWTYKIDAVVLKMVAPAGSQVGQYLGRHGYTAVEVAYMKRME